MASTVGIIAEYNPFHNGHAYQIAQAKKKTEADYCAVIMSGDFIQRGGPAIFDKYTRAQAALLCGADLVLELPPLFATSSAEDFAACGVSLLNSLGVIDFLCFGSECGDLTSLTLTVNALCRETETFKNTLKDGLKEGLTFPSARIRALKAEGCSDAAALLSLPNNILGVEYLKALNRQKSSIKPVTILRTGSGYHEEALPEQKENDSSVYASATAIRSLWKQQPEQVSKELSRYIPPLGAKLFASKTPLYTDDFSALLNQKLIEALSLETNLENISDVSPELAARIRKQTLTFEDWDSRCRSLKTRQYTYTRISRVLTHILLGITKEETEKRKSHNYVSYGRILGFRKEAAPLLSAIKKASSIPMITKTADACRILTDTSYQEFLSDLSVSHLYQAVQTQKLGRTVPNEYIRPMLIL